LQLAHSDITIGWPALGKFGSMHSYVKQSYVAVEICKAREINIHRNIQVLK